MLFDSLERPEDLEYLFDVLMSFADKTNHHPVLTANCLVANPDFDRIRQANYSEYFWQPMVKTYSQTPGAERNMLLWQEGMHAGVCQPQSHGREHLNIGRWLSDLQKRDSVAITAFDHRMFGVSSHITNPPRQSYLAAFDFIDSGERETKSAIVGTALDEFEKVFGFRSRSFMAPNYVWDSEVERAAYAGGVAYLQSGSAQLLPGTGAGKQRERKWRFQGQKSANGQRYIVRNVLFEPASDPSVDWVGKALKDIDLAFKLRKPAVIQTHRVNFVGALSPANRDRGLMLLKRLLAELLKRWPDVEFLNTVELGDRMAGMGDPR